MNSRIIAVALPAAALLACEPQAPPLPAGLGYEFPLHDRRGPLSSKFPVRSPGGAVEKPYEDFDADFVKSLGITELALEKTGCYGLCPEYYLVLRSDGHAFYEGYRDIEPLGPHCAEIDIPYFAILAWLVRDIGYFELEDHYTQMVTDSPSTFTSVVKNGQRKTIRNYAFGAPATLWALETLIDQKRNELNWQPCEGEDIR